MPIKYERKTLRASWAAEDLDEAMRNIKNKTMGVNEASRFFKIPSRTLRRHLLSGKSKGPLGRNPTFSSQYEKKLVGHIKKLEKVGFAPSRKDVKEMAFQLAKKYDIRHPFSENTESAGNVWFTGFMARNPELSQRKSEGLSLARAYGVNRKDVQDFFHLLGKIYEENDFVNHPEDIYNMDETSIQVNNKPGKVIATKGAKDVYTLTSSEKGENVTVIAYCNAQGNFIPPVLIYKGTYNKPQFSEGLPPGSQVFMNKKSSYINSDLFMKWFEEIFLRHKSSRPTLLVLDGHSSHSNNILLLEVAKENNVTLLCLPSHTTHALQPLDRAFFRPLKVYFAQEAKTLMVQNKDKKLTRYDVSKLIVAAWLKAATMSNGISALRTCGIYPFNPNAIPEHYFALSDSLHEQNLIEGAPNYDDETSRESLSLLQNSLESSPIMVLSAPAHCLELAAGSSKENPSERRLSNISVATATIPSSPEHDLELAVGPSKENPNEQRLDNILVTTATIHSPPRLRDCELHCNTTKQVHGKSVTRSENVLDEIRVVPTESEKTPQKQPKVHLGDSILNNLKTRSNITRLTESTPEKTIETPSKILDAIHPVPKLPVLALTKKKQTAVILTSEENIQKRKLIADKKQQPKTKNKKNKQTTQTENLKKPKIGIAPSSQNKKKKGPSKLQRKKKKENYYSSSSDDDNNENIYDTSGEEVSDEDDGNRCAECTENYYETKSSEDWIQCKSCLAWMHEFCTMYNPLCNRCGRRAKRAQIMKH